MLRRTLCCAGTAEGVSEADVKGILRGLRGDNETARKFVKRLDVKSLSVEALGEVYRVGVHDVVRSRTNIPDLENATGSAMLGLLVGFARCVVRDTAVIHKIVENLTSKLDTLRIADLAEGMWCVAVLHYRCDYSHLCSVLTQRITSVTLRSRTVNTLLTSKPPLHTVKVIGNRFLPHKDDATRDLVGVLDAFAGLNVSIGGGGRVLEILSARGSDLENNVVQCLWAAGRLRIRTEDVDVAGGILAGRFSAGVEGLGDAAKVLSAGFLLGNRKLIDVLAKRITKHTHTLPHEQLPYIVEVISRNRYYNPLLTSACLQAASSLPDHLIVSTLPGFFKLSFPPPFSMVLRLSRCPALSQIPSRTLCSIVYHCACGGYPPEAIKGFSQILLSKGCEGVSTEVLRKTARRCETKCPEVARRLYGAAGS